MVSPRHIIFFLLTGNMLQPLTAQFVTNIIPLSKPSQAKQRYQIRDTITTDGATIYVDTIVTVDGKAVRSLSPNNLGKAQMTPVAWGVSGGRLFVGLGATFPNSFTTLNDAAAVVGLTLGDPVKYIGGSVTLNILDVSEFNTLSCNIILNKHFSNSSALSVGAIQLARSKLTDGDPTYFIVYSHALQVASKTPGTSALHFSVGVGSGRFYDQSIRDEQEGHPENGTAVFGNISYELFKWMNLNLEWSGVNLHAGVSVKPFRGIPSIGLGIGDITRYSGDRLRFLLSLGYSIELWKQK